MGPRDSILTCLRKYGVFVGRASRSEFWWFAGIALVLAYAIELGAETLWQYDYDQASNGLDFVLIGLSVCLLLPLLSATVRRFHDVGFNGWLVALLWIATFAAQTVLEIRQPFDLIPSANAGGTELTIDSLYVALLAVTFLCIAAEIAICAWKGTSGHNKYGPNPHKVTS